MQWTALLLMAAITLTAAVYAQIRLRLLAASRNQAWVARAVLVLVGLGFGWTALIKTGEDASAAMQGVVFLAAFGLVHVPAAIILLLKTWQRSDPPPH